LRSANWSSDGSRWALAVGGLRVRNRVEETPEAPLAESLPDGEYAVYGGEPIPDAVKDMFRLTQIGEANVMVIGRDILSITNTDGKRFIMDIKEV